MSETNINIRRSEVLQTVGGILLTICLGLSAWMLSQISEHESKLKVLETQRMIDDRDTAQFKSDIKETLKEIKDQIGRVAEKVGAK